MNTVSAFANKLFSPDGLVKVEIRVSDRVEYDIYKNNSLILRNCSLGLDIEGGASKRKDLLKNVKLSKIDRMISPVVALKFAQIEDKCNVLTINLKVGYSVEFRAYNDGVAYRIITNMKGDSNGKIKVKNEHLMLPLNEDFELHLQPAKDFTSNYETNYIHSAMKTWNKTVQMSTLPALIDTKNGVKVLFSETAVFDYPCMFLKGDIDNGIVSAFSGVALEEKKQGDRFMRITKAADYIAETDAKRSFPWRYFVIASEDKDLLETTLPVKLAPRSVITDTDWIKPGQVSWEWWNAASPYGPDVNFKSGFNLETYKYYIDFASKKGIPYIIMDEGWAESVDDPYTPNKKVDLHELIKYGKQKKVDIILWLTWLSVEQNMGLFETFSQWGIKGVKIDFMDRNDQWMVNYYERVAKQAARYNMLVDFHGSFTPRGLEQKYPNVISYEGVRGLEQMEGCQPDNTIYLPFIRNVVGPMDFTPGAMINMQPEVYGGKRPNSAAVGTRAYQLALFVLFESGVQMLCDNPSLYYKEQECTDFIANVPVTWDETRALKAELGQVALVAKRKGSRWYIGGITNGTARDFKIKMDFLDKHKSYRITYFEDGINADRQAMDYRRVVSQIDTNAELMVKMSRNGGFAAVLTEMPGDGL
ncbi:glycoside hydrolase family 97 protein [Pedobacter sp. BG31]|uniref:glycoside hydrolase family 97 protein n=1 Tax=Pedobacter sp. BG31 TaxID=3349697 RepID=UPI0035F38464